MKYIAYASRFVDISFEFDPVEGETPLETSRRINLKLLEQGLDFDVSAMQPWVAIEEVGMDDPNNVEVEPASVREARYTQIKQQQEENKDGDKRD